MKHDNTILWVLGGLAGVWAVSRASTAASDTARDLSRTAEAAAAVTGDLKGLARASLKGVALTQRRILEFVTAPFKPGGIFAYDKPNSGGDSLYVAAAGWVADEPELREYRKALIAEGRASMRQVAAPMELNSYWRAGVEDGRAVMVFGDPEERYAWLRQVMLQTTSTSTPDVEAIVIYPEWTLVQYHGDSDVRYDSYELKFAEEEDFAPGFWPGEWVK